jgi:hypothetical protein
MYNVSVKLVTSICTILEQAAQGSQAYRESMTRTEAESDPLDWRLGEPLTNRGVLLSTLLKDILHTSHHLLNILLQIANKLGLSNKRKVNQQDWSAINPVVS